jgi:transposase
LPLARKLGVSRKLLHDWRKAWRLHGPAGLNRKRGPKPGPRKLRPLAGPAAKERGGELAQARARIVELERKIGQQALDIDFFQKALRALDAADRQGSIVRASRKSSKL